MWAPTIPSLFTLQVLLRSFAEAQNPTLFSSLSSECISFISQYPPIVSLYASQICRVCQGFQLSPSVEGCCSNTNPTACFASSFYHISVTAPTITPAPALSTATSSVTRVGYYGSTNCDSAISILEDCEAATPGFDNLCFHDQQKCLCSTSGTWAPTIYDDYWSSCLGWASTADPSHYSLLEPSGNRVVQSRKCQTWGALTVSGGTPSNCLTSPSNTASFVSINTAISSSLMPTTTSAAAKFTEQLVSLD